MTKYCPRCHELAFEPYQSANSGEQWYCEVCGLTTEDKMEWERMKTIPSPSSVTV